MALTSVRDFTLNQPRGKVGPIILLCAKGTDNELYVVEIDQNTGQLPVNASGASTTVGLGSPDTVPRNASIVGLTTVLAVPSATGYREVTRTAFTKSVANDASAMDVNVINSFATETTVATLATQATLSAVNGKLASLGQKNMAGSMPVTLASDQGNISVSHKQDIFGIPQYDHLGVTYPNGTTEVYTYKTGGSGGSTVATVTITYTDATKSNISSAART
jgi:hypothetical protein